MLLKININARLAANGSVSEVHIEGSGSKLSQLAALREGIKKLSKGDPNLTKQLKVWHERESKRYEDMGVDFSSDKHMLEEGVAEDIETAPLANPPVVEPSLVDPPVDGQE